MLHKEKLEILNLEDLILLLMLEKLYYTYIYS